MVQHEEELRAVNTGIILARPMVDEGTRDRTASEVAFSVRHLNGKAFDVVWHARNLATAFCAR
jgi:hypothetical protein